MKIIMAPRRIVSVALVALLTAGCAYITKPPAPPEPPPLIEGRDAEFTATCTDVFVTELDRPREQPWGPGDDGLEACLKLARSGYSKEELTEWARSSPEYPQVLERRDREAREAKEAEERRKREEEEREKNRGQLRGRLSVKNGRLVDGEGKPFIWRFVTSFALADQVADGREDDAIAALDWAAATGFNGVRVLSMAKHLFQLAPADGRRAMPRVVELAGARGLHVEIVALADTAAYELDMAAHVRALAGIAVQYENTTFAIANEPRDGTQRKELGDYATLSRLAEGLPAGLLVTHGPSDDDESLTPTGDYVVRHLDRGRDPLNQVRRVRELAHVAGETNLPVINDEPIGCDERPGRETGRQRIAEPWFHAALGILGRGFDAGTTFHLQAGLRSELPGPVQQACADAFIAATRLLSDDLPALLYRNAGSSRGPVRNEGGSKAFEDRGPAGGAKGPIIRAFSFLHPREPWGITVVLHRPEAYPEDVLEFGNGWRIDRELARWKHVLVLRVVR